MKIAIFTDTFFPNVDGVVTLITHLSKDLADKGHKVYIIAPKYNKKETFSYPGIKIFRLKSFPLPTYPEYKITNFINWSIFRKLKKEKIEIVHSHSPFTIGVFGLITAKLLKIPIIGTFHTNNAHPDYLKHVAIINGKFLQNLVLSSQRKYYNHCDLITCPTEIKRKELLKKSFKQPIKTISNGVSLAIFDDSNLKKVKMKYGLDGKVLFFVGRIAHEKNLPYLLECFKIVTNKISNVKLLIVGDGPQMGELKEKINKLGLYDKVVLTGKINHEELVKSSIYPAADLFVTSSITETQSISMLEAQANGLVCIGLDGGGVKDLIKDNYNGFLIKKGNKKDFAGKVILLLQDEKLYSRMKKNTLKEIKKHDINKIIGIWIRLYKGLIKKNIL